MMTPDEKRQLIVEVTEDFLGQRGVNNPCPACSGIGTQTYANTSTWRGGIGGNAMTVGVCNRCWGSGDQDRPWPSHREFDRLKNTPTLDDYQNLEHTLGMRSKYPGYRNYFVAGPDDIPCFERLRAAGFVVRKYDAPTPIVDEDSCSSVEVCYQATVAGCHKVGLTDRLAYVIGKS